MMINTLFSAAVTTTAGSLAESAVEETTTLVEETTTGQMIEEVGAEVSKNLNEAVESANRFIETMEGYIPKLIAFGINVLIAILIFVVGKFIIKFILKIFNRFMDRAGVEISVKKFLDSLLKAALNVILIVIICGQVGIQTTSFVALLTSVGVTIGLALQGSFSNFAGGVLILLLKPFKVGDYIVDGSSGKEGTVQRIDLFYTIIITVDNKQITIPNGNLSNTHITNASAFDTRRVDIKIGVSYDSDVEQARKLIQKIGQDEQARLPEKEAEAYILELAASEVTMVLRVWVKTEDYWGAYFRLNEQLKKTLDNAGIEMPYNQLDVHIRN